jgi:hypothetical protein
MPVLDDHVAADVSVRQRGAHGRKAAGRVEGGIDSRATVAIRENPAAETFDRSVDLGKLHARALKAWYAEASDAVSSQTRAPETGRAVAWSTTRIATQAETRPLHEPPASSRLNPTQSPTTARQPVTGRMRRVQVTHVSRPERKILSARTSPIGGSAELARHRMANQEVSSLRSHTLPQPADARAKGDRPAPIPCHRQSDLRPCTNVLSRPWNSRQCSPV